MSLPLRFLPRIQSLPFRIRNTLPRRNVHNEPDPSDYFENRRQPGWWRRQDFDDKMTYVVTALTIISLYYAWKTSKVHYGEQHDPYGDELLRLEKIKKELDDKELLEAANAQKRIR